MNVLLKAILFSTVLRLLISTFREPITASSKRMINEWVLSVISDDKTGAESQKKMNYLETYHRFISSPETI